LSELKSASEASRVHSGILFFAIKSTPSRRSNRHPCIRIRRYSTPVYHPCRRS
jgi:hypothetical protein